MTHTDNYIPLNFWMLIAQFFCELICCLPYDFDILHHGEKHHLVFAEFLKSYSFDKFCNVINSLDYVLNTSSISNSLSHKSIVYLFGLSRQQKEATTHFPQGLSPFL